MYKTILSAAVVFTALTSSAYSMDAVAAQDQISHELVECFVFHTAIAEGTKSKDLALANQSEQLAQEFLYTALEFSPSEIVVARATMWTEHMSRVLQRHYAGPTTPNPGFSVLISEYAYKCKDLAENPVARIKTLLAQ